MGLQRLLVVIEDTEPKRKELVRQLKRIFLQWEKKDALVPHTILDYENPDQMLHDLTFDPQAMYAMVTDWFTGGLADSSDTLETTSQPIYYCLSAMLGGYDMVKAVTAYQSPVRAAGNLEDDLIQQASTKHSSDVDTHALLSIGGAELSHSLTRYADFAKWMIEPKKQYRRILPRLVANTILYIIWSGRSADATLRDEVEMPFQQVGNINAPLTLWHSKGDITVDALYIAKAFVITTNANAVAGGGLPGIGKVTGPSRVWLPGEMARRYALAKDALINNRLDTFVQEYQLQERYGGDVFHRRGRR